MKTQKTAYQSSLPSNTRNKLVLRRTRKRFNPRIFLDRTIETIAIISLLFTGFAGVGATGCWGMEIATSSHYWQHQKKTCLGMMLVSFLGFLGSSLVGASFGIQRDKF
ncbi:hypothetical protein IQ274_33155 [Nostoc sp. LEGE 12447]|uniref:hypothetical protein n=1 Tax=Nostoc sp. LEGE 12447 TaxID=1828640 RepID=UPI0018838709|nr:hypothetical protein [Nostoc sp. LEGE 12447]MBE9002904.1 hypothetical protein [Nostoc sp. LEGE 12447]